MPCTDGRTSRRSEVDHVVPEAVAGAEEGVSIVVTLATNNAIAIPAADARSEDIRPVNVVRRHQSPMRTTAEPFASSVTSLDTLRRDAISAQLPLSNPTSTPI